MLDSFNVSNPEKIRNESGDTQWEASGSISLLYHQNQQYISPFLIFFVYSIAYRWIRNRQIVLQLDPHNQPVMLQFFIFVEDAMICFKGIINPQIIISKSRISPVLAWFLEVFCFSSYAFLHPKIGKKSSSIDANRSRAITQCILLTLHIHFQPIDCRTLIAAKLVCCSALINYEY